MEIAIPLCSHFRNWNYGKEWGQHYQEPLWAAVGVARSKQRGGTREQQEAAIVHGALVISA